MTALGEKAFCFEGFTFDLKRGCLRHADRAIDLRPKGFELLRYLVENAGRLVPKDELVAALWPKVAVSDESLTRCISDVRLALGDSEQRIIQTVPRRGYLFAAPVSAPLAPASSGAAEPAEATAPRLSIVVLPFVNLSGDVTQGCFVDAITDSLTTDLSRIPGLFVIARNTAFTYKDNPVSARRIGRELGVRYVLEGSVLTGNDRIRVNAQLIDAENSAHLWADRFDKIGTNIFDMQDEIIARLVRTLAVEMVQAESQRAERERPHDMDATDLAMRGWAQYYLPFSVDGVRKARSFFEAALRLDERNVDALIGLANGHTAQVMNWAWDNATEHLSIAEAAVSKALSLAPKDARAHYARARLLEVSQAPELALRGIRDYDCS